MKHTKKITILHSNDLHGDFLAEQVDEKLVGGVSMLSGYIESVRKEEPNTLYVPRFSHRFGIQRAFYD